MLKYALHGELAQLVERQDRTLEASGSIPLFSIACFFVKLLFINGGTCTVTHCLSSVTD